MAAVLHCDVSGAPKPAIAWKKGKNLLFYSEITVPAAFRQAFTCPANWRIEAVPSGCFPGNQILASGSVQLPRFILLESGGLQITPVFLQDAGNYTCWAVNSEGALSASAALTVWSKDHYLFSTLLLIKA